jgi:hypothetical protein
VKHNVVSGRDGASLVSPSKVPVRIKRFLFLLGFLLLFPVLEIPIIFGAPLFALYKRLRSATVNTAGILLYLTITSVST